MRFNNHSRLKIGGFANFKFTWQTRMLQKYITPSSKLLDLGCAAGKLSRLIPDKYNYYGVDYNEDFEVFGKKNNLKIRCYDISKERLPFEDNTFDIVWFRHVIEHLQVKEQFFVMKEILRVLKPGGKVFVFAPTPYHWFFWDNDTHVRPCTHGQLEHLAKDLGFSKAVGKYSLLRKYSGTVQRMARVTPLRWFLWETFLEATK